MRETFKKYGATDAQLDTPIPVMVDKPIDNMPTGMIRGLTPDAAFEAVTSGAARFVFKPVESAPPPFMMHALEAHVAELRARGEGSKAGWFLRLIADTGRAMGKGEAEIDERLAELREELELSGPAAEGETPAPVDEEPKGEGGGAAGEVPEGMRGALLKLSDDDALALVETTADVEQLEAWLDVESLQGTPRKAVMAALEDKIDSFYEGEGAAGTSSPDSSSPPAAGGQGAPSPTAPGDAPPPPAPTPTAPTSTPAAKPSSSSSSKKKRNG